MNIYFLQSHKLNFLKHSYFYKLVLLLVKTQISLQSLISLVNLHHTLYKMYCFFIQIAQTDQAAEICRPIRVFTERTCYFAEINVICLFSTCQKLKFFFRCILHFYDKTCFPVLSIINHYLLKAEGNYYYALNCWER